MLKPYSNRTGLIVGGKEKTIGFKDIHVSEEGGLTVLKVPNIPHLIQHDSEWLYWVPFISKTIAFPEEPLPASS